MTHSLSEIVEELNSCEGDLLALMRLLKLDPAYHFRGGDWRGCSFQGLDLEGFDLTHARFHDAKFDGAKVAGANFSGSDLGFRSTLYRAIGWREAILDPSQRSHLEAQQALDEAGGDTGRPMPPVWRYVRLISDAETYDEGLLLYERMLTEEVRPNAHIYTTLIDKMPYSRWSEAPSWLAVAETCGVRADEPMYSALIRKADFKQAKSLFEECRAGPGISSSYAYVAICDVTPSLSAAEPYLREMALTIGLDARALNAAIKDPWRRQVSFDRAFDWVRRAIDASVHLDTKDLAALLRVARHDHSPGRFEDRRSVVMDLRHELDLPHDNQIINAEISTAPNLNEAISYFDERVSEGFRPDRYTFRALKFHPCGFDEALLVLHRMRQQSEDFDLHTVEWLKARVPQESRKVKTRKLHLGGPDVVIATWIREHAHPSVRKDWLEALFPNP